MNNLSISDQQILEVSNITKKEFNKFLLMIRNFIPYYKERNNQEYILNRVLNVVEHFNLDMSVFTKSKEILFRFWDSIKSTKDDVIAGLVTSISVLCMYRKELTVNAICKLLNIRMSTIQSQVEKRLFKRFKVSGFKSLVKSADLLKKLMQKLGIIEKPEEIDEISDRTQSINILPGILNFRLGNCVPVFSAQGYNDEYFRAILRAEDIINVVTKIIVNQSQFEDMIIDNTQSNKSKEKATSRQFFRQGVNIEPLKDNKGPPKA